MYRIGWPGDPVIVLKYLLQKIIDFDNLIGVGTFFFKKEEVSSMEEGMKKIKEYKQHDKEGGMTEILNVIHNTIYQFFDVCGDDEEVPMSDKDKLLLEVNKAICNNLKALEQKVRDKE